MKKLVASIGVFVLFTLLSVSHISASEVKEGNNSLGELVEKHNSEVSTDEAFEKAKMNGEKEVKVIKGKKVINGKKIMSNPIDKYNEEQSGDLRLEEYEVEEIIGTYVDENGEEQELKANTTFLAASDASDYDSGMDSTLAVRAHSTVFYDHVYDSRGAQHEEIVEVTGEWEIHFDRVSLKNPKVTIGQTGWSSFTNGSLSGQVVNRYPNGLTYSYNAPSSWVPVVVDGGGNWTSGAVGVTMDTTLVRGTTEWNLTFNNNL